MRFIEFLMRFQCACRSATMLRQHAPQRELSFMLMFDAAGATYSDLN